VAFVELEEPNRVKRSVGRATKPVYELIVADRALFALSGRLQKVGSQPAEPMSLDADAVAKNLTIMMEVEAADHPLDRGVMGFRVPTTPLALAINDARGGRQPDPLQIGKEALVQPAIASNPPECRLP